MSAILIAAFKNHATADAVRTRLVQDGFPTDRIELTSREEPGQAELVPRGSFDEKLTEYFRTLFEGGGYRGSEGPVSVFQRAVLDDKGVLTLHPRGDNETESALQILNEAGPEELQGADLQSKPLEQAASSRETPGLTWMGKVLAAPGAKDTTGLAKLP
jgi:hypothetical protein